jgi:hypothetical protein
LLEEHCRVEASAGDEKVWIYQQAAEDTCHSDSKTSP